MERRTLAEMLDMQDKAKMPTQLFQVNVPSPADKSSLKYKFRVIYNNGKCYWMSYEEFIMKGKSILADKHLKELCDDHLVEINERECYMIRYKLDTLIHVSILEEV